MRAAALTWLLPRRSWPASILAGLHPGSSGRPDACDEQREVGRLVVEEEPL